MSPSLGGRGGRSRLAANTRSRSPAPFASACAAAIRLRGGVLEVPLSRECLTRHGGDLLRHGAHAAHAGRYRGTGMSLQHRAGSRSGARLLAPSRSLESHDPFLAMLWPQPSIATGAGRRLSHLLHRPVRKHRWACGDTKPLEASKAIAAPFVLHLPIDAMHGWRLRGWLGHHAESSVLRAGSRLYAAAIHKVRSKTPVSTSLQPRSKIALLTSCLPPSERWPTCTLEDKDIVRDKPASVAGVPGKPKTDRHATCSNGR